MKISQSMLKMFQRYLTGDDCGLQFEAKYITETFPEEILDPTDPREAGNWFEFMATGSTPRGSGRIPEPARIKSGELNATYKYLQAHLPMWGKLNPPGARYGQIISNETAIFGHTLEGITDVMTDEITGDIKTTGKIADKWDEYGWGGDAEIMSNRPAMFQAKMYTLIRWLNDKKIYPFWFWVFSSNSDKAKQIKVTMSESALKAFQSEVEYLVQAIESELGEFKAVPTFERCGECPLKCEFKQVLPDIVEINY